MPAPVRQEHLVLTHPCAHLGMVSPRVVVVLYMWFKRVLKALLNVPSGIDPAARIGQASKCWHDHSIGAQAITRLVLCFLPVGMTHAHTFYLTNELASLLSVGSM